MKLPAICTNWKMNKTREETRDYFLRFLDQADRFKKKIEIIILVPHSVLALSADLTKGSDGKGRLAGSFLGGLRALYR